MVKTRKICKRFQIVRIYIAIDIPVSKPTVQGNKDEWMFSELTLTLK